MMVDSTAGVSRVAVVGPGSIGTYLAAQMQAAGFHVTFIGPPSELPPEHSVLINGRPYMVPAATTMPVNCEFDLIVVCVKAAIASAVCNQLAESQVNGKSIAFVHNGFLDKGAYGVWEDSKVRAHIIVFSGYERVGDELRISEGIKGWQTSNDPVGSRVHNLLRTAGVPVSSTSEFDKIRMEKFLMNVVVNAVAALENKKIGEVFESHELRRYLSRIFNEAVTVFEKRDGASPTDITFESFADSLNPMLGHRTSMLQDLEANRCTEIEALNGYLVRLGRQLGVDTPFNDEICRRFERGFVKRDGFQFCLQECHDWTQFCAHRSCDRKAGEKG
jgi:2-dehydropantoate 2-reductase